MSVHSWVSEHKLASIGAVWAAGIGASFLANSRKTSAMKPSLRLIHARMHAQALTLAVLSSAAAYHYYENRLSSDARPPKPQAETARSDIRKLVEWELLSPF
ncbi:uncharacterized protein LOC114752549 [Neltuma alba]|uniref:uncharacterized protein LOC114735297 n=1 Tax=Neltuma alba TaxID=207710 RepID=UPI0010A57A1A|nr:uncharacterized protein LOC114735297 [Prosopis alba]XP_028797121.1 uncharacterized protein LOC114752549 [Prosopis alba]